jgi:hypothetical protein
MYNKEKTSVDKNVIKFFFPICFSMEQAPPAPGGHYWGD